MKTATSLYMVAATAAIAVLCTGGCKNHKPLPHSDLSEPAKVRLEEPRRECVTLSREYPGVLRAASEVEATSRVEGRLLSRARRSGERVERGEVLYRIEPGTYQDAVRQAEATLASAESQVTYARTNYEALKEAYGANAVAEIQVKEAENTLRQAEASVSNAKAALHTARQNLDHCTVRAPISGILTNGEPDVGSYVSPGTTLGTIYDTSTLHAVFAVEASEFEQIKSTGGEAYRRMPLKVEGAEGYTADLYYVSPTVDASTGLLTLKGRVENRHGTLRDGMYVSISLPTESLEDALLVDYASVGSDGLGEFLYTVDEQGCVQKSHIRSAGLWADSLLIVTAGLKPGTRYVKDALMSVRVGERVEGE